MIKSNLHPIDYKAEDVVRICNVKQQIFYLSSNVYPVDIYTSYDGKNDRKIIVMIFLKVDTQELYKKWCNYDLD